MAEHFTAPIDCIVGGDVAATRFGPGPREVHVTQQMDRPVTGPCRSVVLEPAANARDIGRPLQRQHGSHPVGLRNAMCAEQGHPRRPGGHDAVAPQVRNAGVRSPVQAPDVAGQRLRKRCRPGFAFAAARTAKEEFNVCVRGRIEIAQHGVQIQVAELDRHDHCNAGRGRHALPLSARMAARSAM